MGEAKRRGTFEERKAQAILRQKLAAESEQHVLSNTTKTDDVSVVKRRYSNRHLAAILPIIALGCLPIDKPR